MRPVIPISSKFEHPMSEGENSATRQDNGLSSGYSSSANSRFTTTRPRNKQVDSVASSSVSSKGSVDSQGSYRFNPLLDLKKLI